MSRTKVKLKSAGIRDVFGQWAKNDGEPRIQRAAEQWRATAPVVSGAYRDSIRTETVQHPSRPVCRAIADVDYAMEVEADHGTGARALDAAGGS